jgi:hypothetical protein
LASEKTYRTVTGIVQFDPEEREAAGKDVRKVTIRQAGFKEQAIYVSLTLWPSHAAFDVAQGDVIIAEGAYTQNKGKGKDGAPKTYHNLSVGRIFNLGQADSGTRVETTNDDDADDPDTDDIPY